MRSRRSAVSRASSQSLQRTANGNARSVRDLVTALQAVAIGALVESTKGCVHLVERFRLHLDQRELDILLDIDLGALALVQNVSFLVAIRPGVANLLVYRVQQLPTAILEHFLQLVIAAPPFRDTPLRAVRPT